MKPPTLDLHGIRHDEVPDVIAKFLWKHWGYKDDLHIITGNSCIMRYAVLKVLEMYNTRKIESNDIGNWGRVRVWLAN